MKAPRDVILPLCVVILSTVLPPVGAQEPPDRAAPAHPVEHVVAVLSPSDGPLREVGRLHDESVRRVFGLGESNETIISGHPVRFVFRGTGDPVGSLDQCAQEAERVVEVEEAVAILGPVASGCSTRVLSLGLQVPVVSSLSTARSLGGSDEWFFRTIAHDHRRLEAFVDTARGRGMSIGRSIAIYEPSAYGQGLLDHLQELVPGVDSAHVFRWDQVFGGPGHEVAVTEAFRASMDTHDHPLESVFVLASSDRMVEHMRVLDAMFGGLGAPDERPEIVLVGSTEPANLLPDATWLIAEAQVRTSRNLVSPLERQGPSEDLYISSLDASIALREALAEVLDPSDAASADLARVRAELRRTLDEGTFPSSERYRAFSFVDGEITPSPAVPIYRVVVEEVRRLESVNADVPRPWVEIRLRRQPRGHLEGPVVVELVPHGDELVGERVAVQLAAEGSEAVTVREVELGPQGATVSLTPTFVEERWFPAELRITTDRTPSQESVVIAKMGWPASYMVALLAALVGSLVYARSRRTSSGEDEEGGEKTRMTWSFAERAVAGLLIAFLIIHVAPLLEGEPVLSQIPIPRFGSSPWLNAFAAGVLGGWLGLTPIVGFATSVIGALAPLFHSESA